MNAISRPDIAGTPARQHPVPAVAVLVLPGFSLLSLGAIVEPLALLEERAADFDHRTYGLATRQVRSRTGREFRCDGEFTALETPMMLGRAPKFLIICGGAQVTSEDIGRTLPMLRRAMRSGTRVIAIGSANRLLAEAGMLDGQAGAVHWSSAHAFGESYPTVEVTSGLYALSGQLGTCAGEAATFDMIVELIRREVSAAAAQTVCDHLLVSHPRLGKAPQPGAAGERVRYLPEVLQQVIGHMAENIETPLSAAQLFAGTGLSSRHFERMFRRHLGTPPMRYYLEMRLAAAYQLVTQSGLELREVALATGFANLATLSRRFRQHYGETPSTLRKSLAGTGQGLPRP